MRERGASTFLTRINPLLHRIDPLWGFAIAVVATALGWTFFHLGDRSLWWDELWTVGLASPDTPSGEALQSIRGDVHPPLYFFGVRAWLALLHSSSEWAARSFNIVALAAALLAAGWAYRTRVAAPLGTWFALFFLSFGLLWYLQEARMYAFVICHAFLTCVFALVYEQERERPPTLTIVLATIIVFVVLPFVHWFAGLFSGLILFGLFLLAVIERRYTYALLFFGAGVAFAALMVGWVLVNWQSTLGLMGHYGDARGWVRWELRRSFVGTMLFSFTLNPILIVAAGSGAWCLWVERPSRPVLLTIFACSAIAVIIILLMSITTPMYQTPNFTWFVAPATLLSAIGLTRAAARLALRRWQAGAVLAGILVLNVLLGRGADRVYPLERDLWRDAGQLLLAQPGCANAPIPAVMQWLHRSMAGGASLVQHQRIYGYYGGGPGHFLPVYREDTELPRRAVGTACPVLLWIGQMTEEDAQSRGAGLLGGLRPGIKIIRFPGQSLFLAAP
jgi:hypothetical protein